MRSESALVAGIARTARAKCEANEVDHTIVTIVTIVKLLLHFVCIEVTRKWPLVLCVL